MRGETQQQGRPAVTARRARVRREGVGDSRDNVDHVDIDDEQCE